jgi:hypothetical protein
MELMRAGISRWGVQIAVEVLPNELSRERARWCISSKTM